MRTYDDLVEVRKGPLDGLADESEDGPEQFLWRGRLWQVREVIAHWVETGAWWIRRPEDAPGQSEITRELGERPEVPPVQVAPHQGGDHTRYGVRQEDAQPEDPCQPQQSAVDRQRGQEGDQQHHGHLDEEEQADPPDT